MPAVIPAVAAVGGALISSRAAKKQTEAANQANQAAIDASKMDPRNEAMLYGSNGQNGLLSQFQGLMNTPQSDASKAYSGANADYLTQFGGQDLSAIRNTATGMMRGNSAPTVTATTTNGAATTLPAYLTPTKIDAPSQNNINLSGSYNSLINGAPGANPYLTGAIQKGINQSTNAFGNMIQDAKQATQDVLGNVRGSAVASGMFGSSRQGIAEGRALESMNTQLGRAASQFGQNNTDAAVAAQAGAYNTDRDRQLAATQGLGAQQYGVAQQNAAMKQQADALNVNNLFDAAKMNASLTQQTELANQAARQQAQLANQGAQLQTNAQNNSAAIGGAGLLAGLNGQAAGVVNAQDNYALNKAQGVNGLLMPYLTKNPVQVQQQPVYSNSGGAAIGGAMAGLGLYNQFQQASGGANPRFGNVPAPYSFTPSTNQPIDYNALGAQAMNFSFGK